VAGVSSESGSWSGGTLLADTYLLGRTISRGGMGEVYEATHARLPGRYAVKVLLPELLGNREAFARFCREAEVMSELRHPNVVQIFDFNTTPDGRPYFVMEYLEGRDLESRLTTLGPLPLPAAVRVVDSVASALAAAHAHGIVHRDLKPANIFLVTVEGQPDELVKVLDFGISKVRAAGTLLSAPRDVLGTPPYMSPEQARGATHLIDGRTDQFALGAITYRMLTGHEPFTGNDIASLLYQVVHQDPPPLSHFVPVSWDTRALQAVLDRALAKDPRQRWSGMMEMARAFEAASEQTLSHLSPDSGPIELSATLVAAPPPPPAAPVERAPVERRETLGGFPESPAMRPVTPAPVLRPRTPTPVVTTTYPAPVASHVTDAPPPVRTPPPEVAPPHYFDPSLTDERDPRVVRRPSGKWETMGGWEPTGSVDYVPREHRGLAALAVALIVAAALLGLTGAYRRIPSAVSAIGRRIHGRSAPISAPAAPTRAAPAPAAEGPPPVSAPATPEPARQEAAPAAAAPPAPAQPASEPRAGEPKATSSEDQRDTEGAPRAKTPASKPHRQRHPKSESFRSVDHPGSIDLSSPSSGAASPGPPAQPAPAPSGPAAAPAPRGFSIEPAAPTEDSPRHDLAPPSTDPDQTLPPSVH
jgi:serine/threonine protein kinase